MSLTTTSNNTSTGVSLVPQTMDQAVRMAELMSAARTLPTHLQKNPGDCLMVVEQAMRWGMSPFAVAQCTSVIQGKLMFEGKLVAAALHSSGALSTRLHYEYRGEGDTREIIVSATLAGETKPRDVTVKYKDAKTTNGMWTKQPDQQLAYHGARVWARRFAPEVMLGVYAPEEMEPVKAPDTFAGPTISGRAEPATREAINTEVPITPRKQTITEWLDALETELKAAADGPAVDAIIARVDVQKAQDAFKNGARDRLNAMVKDALDRTSVDADSAFLAEPERMET